MAQDADMGLRIKERRREVGLSLRKLAERADLTASFLSQVERGQASTSIGSLRRIAEALDVPILHFLENGLHHGPQPGDDGLKYSPLVCANRRRRLILPDSQVIYEMLVPDLGRKMEAFCGRIAPGTGNMARRLRVPTEEFIYVLAGALTIGLGQDEYKVCAGDSIYFEGSTLTKLACASSEEAIWISVITPPVF
jgi:transcriptional regulator with XRE-family HTH domain